MAMIGETWNCPHCGQSILRSAMSCPACLRRLRFDAASQARSAPAPVCPLSIEGVIRHPGAEGPREYSVLVEVHDAQGEMVTRRVVGVGAIHPGEARRFTLRVEMHEPEASAPAAPGWRGPAFD